MSSDTHAPSVAPVELTAAKITDDILAPVFKFPPFAWWGAFLTAAGLTGALFLAFALHCVEGIGIFGINSTIGWGNYIVTYVFWIGIAVSGTLVSSILFLFRQRWRNAINRSTEAMTVFAVSVAGLFPALHTGRPWVDYWLMPYPNDLDLWPQFKSPIIWDVFAITGYATTSVIFFYLGLIPDLATVRDRAKHPLQKMIYGALAMGWKGTASDWRHYERSYAQFAWLATPLVLGMHSTIATLLAVGQVPGWHSTVFPPYFVSGAIFGGLAMALALLIPMRAAFQLKQYITIDHLERIAKIMLACGLIVTYVYITEFFTAWYSESVYERGQFLWYRLSGPHAWAWILMQTCNTLIPQLLWFRSVRRSIGGLMFVALAINLGMWLERFVISCLSLEADHLPANWSYYTFSGWDWFILLGSFGMFFTMFLGFIRVAPVISIAEIKSVLLQPKRIHASRPDGTNTGVSEVNRG
ncbi:MAG: polysulfide reductase NrfD [Planctomycetes bacterium]|nr:polysulfide reductase NrfD [Planctomycetota bacterium]